MVAVKLSKITKFARIVSWVFDGSVLALPVFIAASFYKMNDFSRMMPSFLVAIFFIALLPYTLILILYKSGKLSELQMPKRKERLLPLLAVNLSIFTGFLILTFTSPGNVLKTVYMVYILGLPSLSIITLFYKISFHASYITMFSITYIMIFGKWAIFTLLLIPVVCWSRVHLKRHTPGQVLLGAGLTATASGTVFAANGYPVYENLFLGSMRNAFQLITKNLKTGFPGSSINMLFFFVMFALVIYLNMLIFSEKSYPSKRRSLFT